MSYQVVVRAVQRADFLQWQPLWDDYNAFYGRAGDTALAAEITQMTWARFFDAHEPVHALVARPRTGSWALRIFSIIAARFKFRRPATLQICSPRILCAEKESAGR
jgi:hypothetical protein